MRNIILWLIALLSGLAHPGLAAGEGEQEIWAALKEGGYVVLIRHAITDPGIGDPDNFKLGDCSTQRNLSAQGRADAKRIGEAFRRQGIPVSEVLSSRWCRCIDTAQLAFGKVTPSPMLDSIFTERGKAAEERTRSVADAIARMPPDRNLVMVTHQVNIQALAGVSVAAGEVVVAKPGRPSGLAVVGRLRLH